MKFNPGPELITHYFKDLSPLQIQQLHQLGPLYAYWNQRINVISRKDMEHFYQNHVLHSLGLTKVKVFQPGSQVLDLGTGGGFPGIPLAILLPEVQFHLIDSIGKKIKVVQQVIEKLELKNASCQQIRAEQHTGHYDYVVTRAVTRLSALVKWTKPLLAKDGQLLCLKGGELADEIAEVNAKVASFALSEFFTEPFFETKKILAFK
jgi:16S rRNA (guanine527-N7)-methyltransferase